MMFKFINMFTWLSIFSLSGKSFGTTSMPELRPVTCTTGKQFEIMGRHPFSENEHSRPHHPHKDNEDSVAHQTQPLFSPTNLMEHIVKIEDPVPEDEKMVIDMREDDKSIEAGQQERDRQNETPTNNLSSHAATQNQNRIMALDQKYPIVGYLRENWDWWGGLAAGIIISVYFVNYFAKIVMEEKMNYGPNE
ncbi:hypothetical protein PGT21_009470 [Puccinia graminis f. sp. tritici]|uniref:Copper transporter n=1 Tax=Puccinia graminis f. sp. tritici TaxID=56615 RepID=A0A5B0MMF5_PUCGR|nr:hypothetical protein PGT21_009470 [Puccinia graminis f. sp. tritici]